MDEVQYQSNFISNWLQIQLQMMLIGLNKYALQEKIIKVLSDIIIFIAVLDVYN